MEQVKLPKNVSRIATEETFSFACHPEVDCFTDCCKQLELALTPYDVLRLTRETGMDSGSFLEQYVIQEQEADDSFPRFYLTMVDDGHASCVFVSDKGCTVYPGRPGACRAYPMGRAAIRQDNNSMEEFFVLLKESHCHGFAEKEKQNSATYSNGQGLTEYNRYNDAVAHLLQHDKIRKGLQLTPQQIDYFILALYDLDSFRKQLQDKTLAGSEQFDTTAHKTKEQLLLFGIEWLQQELFTS
jgi:Fe-S-cluster containining protein